MIRRRGRKGIRRCLGDAHTRNRTSLNSIIVFILSSAADSILLL